MPIEDQHKFRNDAEHYITEKQHKFRNDAEHYNNKGFRIKIRKSYFDKTRRRIYYQIREVQILFIF